MSNYKLYYQSIDDASLTYSATATTNYPETRTKDRNQNTYFKDSPGVPPETLEIDLGSGNTRAADYLILGNFKIDAGAPEITLEGKVLSGDSWTTIFSSDNPNINTTYNYIKTFSETTAYRYFKITFSSVASNIDTLEIATIFLGTVLDFDHNPELNIQESRTYRAVMNESPTGYRYGQQLQSKIRRIWGLDYKGISPAEKSSFEDFADVIKPTDDLSALPFYLTDDGGTNLYFARLAGQLKFQRQAYQLWQTNINLEGEL